MPPNGYDKGSTLLPSESDSNINIENELRNNLKREILGFEPVEWFGTKFIKRVIYKCSNGHWLPHIVTVTDPRLIGYINEMQNSIFSIEKIRNEERNRIGEPSDELGNESNIESNTETRDLVEEKENANTEEMDDYEQIEIESEDNERRIIRSSTDRSDLNQIERENVFSNGHLNGFLSMYEYKTVTPFIGNIRCNIDLERNCVICGNQIKGAGIGTGIGTILGKQYLHFNYYEGLCDKCATIMREKYRECDFFIKKNEGEVCNIDKECPILKKCNREHVILIGILGLDLGLTAIRIIIMIVERGHAMDALRKFGAVFYIMIDDCYNCNKSFKNKCLILRRIFPEFNDLVGMTTPIYSYFKLNNLEWRLECIKEYYIDQFANEISMLLNFIEYRIRDRGQGKIANWDKANWIFGKLLGYVYLRIKNSGLLSEPNINKININISSGCILEDYWIPNNIQVLIQQTKWTACEKKTINGEILGSIGPIFFTQDEVIPFGFIIGGSIR